MTLKDEIKELKVRIKKLEKDSHPPIFKEDAYEMLNCRLMIIETFFLSRTFPDTFCLYLLHKN